MWQCRCISFRTIIAIVCIFHRNNQGKRVQYPKARNNQGLKAFSFLMLFTMLTPVQAVVYYIRLAYI